jgi:hypothetical protein
MIGKIRDTITGLWPVIKTYVPKPGLVLTVVVAFIIGLIWAYSLDPVVFYGADPKSLDQSWQDQWVSMVADSYILQTSNAAATDALNQTTVRLLEAVDDPVEIVQRLSQNNPNVAQIADLAAQAEPNAARAPQPSIIASIRPFILGAIVIAVLTVIFSLLYGFYINPMLIEPIRKRARGAQGTDAAAAAKLADIRQGRKLAEELAKQDAAAPATSSYGPPVTRHVSIYAPGRAFDDSFGIEDASKGDEFLGECGAVISETVGTDEKVTAIEVWLFDKEDFVRTLTGVFASEYAANDPALRSKLETKGEVVVARPGATLVLETNALRMQARIVDMAYGSGPLPPNSYFEKMTIELQTWRKDGKGAPVIAPAPVAAVPAAPPPAAPVANRPFTPPPVSSAAPTTQINPPPAPPPSYSNPTFAPPPMSPPASSPPPARRTPPPDDDPFGGTGDFTPVS